MSHVPDVGSSDRGVARRKRSTFYRRALLSVFNGMLFAKVERHLLMLPLVHRPLHALLGRIFPINRRKVVCVTFAGAYECNPKYIAEELHRRGGFEIVWLIGAADYRARSARVRALGFRTVPMWSLRANYHILTAGTLVDNAQTLLYRGMPPKRSGQIHLNTWHGSLGIKRLTSAGRNFNARVAKAGFTTDAVLVNSDFEERVFSESVFPRTPKLRFGHPRNDVFFRPVAERAEIRDRVRAELGLAEGEKFALYAPTFREVAFFTAAGGLAFERWAAALGERFGGTWRIVLRLHPHDAQALAEGLISVPKGVCDASSREDIQELLVAADAGITDYSSWIFDYLLGGGPGFVFAPDKAKYDESRGFYYPLEETPFPVAESEVALCAAIRAFDMAKYAADREIFLKARGCYERGDASARAADWIEGKVSSVARRRDNAQFMF